MGDTRDVYHIGLGKAGSTYLQRRVFPLLDGFRFQTSHKSALEPAFQWVHKINGPYVQLKAPRKEKRLALSRCFEQEYGKLTPVTRSSTTDRLLVSSEGFVGVSYDPLLNADMTSRMLARLSPNACIVLCLRRQDEYCESLYRQLVFAEDRFRRYINFEELYGPNETVSAVPYECLAWDKIVETYFEHFGPRSVCVLPYEQLRADPGGFFRTLFTFLSVTTPPKIDYDVRENARPGEVLYRRPRYSVRARALAAGMCDCSDRAFHELIGVWTDLKSLGRFEGRKFNPPDDDVLSSIRRALRRSNKRLSTITGIDFGIYGYH